MSKISCNPSSAAQGSVLSPKALKSKLFEQIQLALAVKMGLNGPQQVKERALHNVLTSKSARGDVKQILQSRAEIHRDMLEPNYFKANADLGGKAKAMRQKNQARSQLAGAPLLVAQLGALEFRNWLMKGDNQVIPNVRLGQQMTAAEFFKRMSKAPPMALLQLCYGTDGYNFVDSMLQHADDLDFVQDVLCAVGDSLELNPILNGVLAGFNRRRRYQRFKFGHHTLELDRLRFGHTVSEKDSDLHATEISGKLSVGKGGKSTRKNEPRYNTVCSYYQRAVGCSFESCRYAHKCSVCYKSGHGAVDCWQRRYQGEREEKTRERRGHAISRKTKDVPPHPRFRRARASDQRNESKTD